MSKKLWRLNGAVRIVLTLEISPLSGIDFNELKPKDIVRLLLSPPLLSGQQLHDLSMDTVVIRHLVTMTLDEFYAIVAPITASLRYFAGDVSPAKQQCQDQCIICLDRHTTIALGCSHKYCQQCIDDW